MYEHQFFFDVVSKEFVLGMLSENTWNISNEVMLVYVAFVNVIIQED